MNNTMLLQDRWTLCGAGKTVPAKVPGDITTDLYKAGLIPDPYFGLNHRQLGWIIETDFVYSTVFDVPEEILCREEILLQFDAIDTFSEIVLNGTPLGRTENMFLRYSYSVKTLLKATGNTLEVRLSSTKKVMDAIDDSGYFGVFNCKRLFIRKAQCHFGWDWAPDMPGYGICGGVRLMGVCRNRIDNISYRATNDGNLTLFAELNYTIRPQVDFQGKLVKDTNKECRGDRLRYTVATLPGRPLYEAQPLVEECVIGGKKNFRNFVLPAPAIWYPNGRGDHPLYAYRVELLRDGTVVDAVDGRFAFREVALVQKPTGADTMGYSFRINGEDTFIKGSNWVPVECFSGNNTDGKYRRLLRRAADAGLNMLRVWGGGIYENDIFYDLCDELGILVWQDLMFACADIPEDRESFVENVRQEVTYQVKRLRNHPSLVYWCGGNEKTGTYGLQISRGDYFVDVFLRGLVGNLDDTRPYARQSPCSLTDIGNDRTSGESHAGSYETTLLTSPLDYRKNVAESLVPFVSECATMSVGSAESLARIFPADKLWPPNEYWHDRLMNNPYSGVDMSFVDRQLYYADGLYGKSAGLAEFAAKSMTVHAEVMRAEIEFARFNRARCGGFMNWMYSDIWPSATWSVVDYDGEAKSAYYQMKRSYAPLLLTFVQTREGTNLAVINDTPETVCTPVRYGLKDLDGRVIWSREALAGAAPRTVWSEPVTEDFERENTYLFAETTGDGVHLATVYSYDMWHSCRFTSDYTYEVSPAEGGLSVTVTAQRFAKGVTIRLPENNRYDYSDNFFDLQAGESRTVLIRGEISGQMPEVTDLAKESAHEQ